MPFEAGDRISNRVFGELKMPLRFVEGGYPLLTYV